MDIDLSKLKKQRMESLTNAYNQLDKMLNIKIDAKEVDPEKRRAAAIMYKQAAEDSDFIFRQLTDLWEEEGHIVPEKKKKSAKLSPEDRMNR